MKKILIAVFLLSALILSACSAASDSAVAPTDISLYNDPSVKIAVEVGTVTEDAVRKELPDATYIYVNNVADGYLSVQSGQADAYAGDKATFQRAHDGGLSGLTCTEHTFGAVGYVAVGISPKAAFDGAEELINSFLAEMEAQGVLADVFERWVTKGDYNMPETAKPENPERTIRIGTSGLMEPYTFYVGTELSGGEIELINRFALWANANVEVSVYDWSGIVPACASGKVDYIISDLFDTPERRESIGFSTPYLEVSTVLIIPDTAIAGSEKGFFDSLAESFEKTFIRENRWKLLASGFGVTLLISVLTAFFGTVLGFGLCLQRRGRNRFFSALAAVFIRMVQGVPIVVLLMILYFIVFASSDAGGVLVATIAFTINFGVYVSEMMRAGIDAVDRGQWEAADALGFGRAKTFRRIIAPQALRHILPVYKGEFISMVKMTSVVGYIAIQDLTKAGDIIRSRTYEAFFPLIVTAIIYFLLSWGLTQLISLIEIRTDPAKRPRSPRGVDIALLETQEDEAKPAARDRDAVITIEHLKKEYPNVTPLQDVNEVIHRGDVVAIIGPSGTGKSTLLRCINRLEVPTDGKISVLGSDMDGERRKIEAMRQRLGMVFQSFNLFPHLTVAENIMLAPVEMKGETPQRAWQQAMRLLRSVGLAEKALAYPDELSGGQKQRVAIARALAMKPEIVLFDEPTSALDPTMVGEVLSVIRKLAADGYTMLIVTHEMKFARDISTRVFYMDEGVIYEEGAPEQIFEKPQRERTRAFVKRLKTYAFETHSKDFDFLAVSGELEEFGFKQALSKKQINKIQLVFEELGVNIIRPKLPETEPFLRFAVEYSEEDSTVALEACCNGGELDPLSDNGDELSALLLTRMTEGFTATYENGVNLFSCKLPLSNK